MNSETTINPQFTASIASGLEYWQAQTENSSDETISRLDARRQNLMRIVSYGLKLAPTQQAAAAVCLQAFPLIERRGYWQEWIPLLKSAANNIHDDLVLQVKLLNRLGELYRISRQLPAAIETHLQAEKLSQQTDKDHLRHHI